MLKKRLGKDSIQSTIVNEKQQFCIAIIFNTLSLFMLLHHSQRHDRPHAIKKQQFWKMLIHVSFFWKGHYVSESQFMLLRHSHWHDRQHAENFCGFSGTTYRNSFEICGYWKWDRSWLLIIVFTLQRKFRGFGNSWRAKTFFVMPVAVQT